MKAGVLFSGGKDSALAAVLLSRDYEVELNTFVFGGDTLRREVCDAAASLGFPHKTWVFGDKILSRAVDLVVRCGYPNDAINMVHLEAVTALTSEYRVVADGTRFNDRVPMIPRSEVQRLGNRYGCAYVRPLLGFPKAEVDRLVERHLVVRQGETGTIQNGDYERAIRKEMQTRGYDLADFFPGHHEQSLVITKKMVNVNE
ncbi:MAG TPA: alpha hydrolase [Methanoregulaceae archaeon]|nr:alpha hydrolase [Methanoregulaceae archaeon]